MRFALIDVDVWLATLVESHPHHPAATAWWREHVEIEDHRVAFCRVTQLGLLRLLTNEAVMGDQRQTIAEAWSLYERVLSQPPVVFADEPPGTEALLKEHCERVGSSTKFWTDGYLAAFARAGELTLVSFDRDFERFPALRLRLLGRDPA